MKNKFPSKEHATGHVPFSQGYGNLDSTGSALNNMISQKVKYTIETYHIITVNSGDRWKTFRFLAPDNQAVRDAFIIIQKKANALTFRHVVWQEYLDDIDLLLSSCGADRYLV